MHEHYGWEPPANDSGLMRALVADPAMAARALQRAFRIERAPEGWTEYLAAEADALLAADRAERMRATRANAAKAVAVTIGLLRDEGQWLAGDSPRAGAGADWLRRNPVSPRNEANARDEARRQELEDLVTAHEAVAGGAVAREHGGLRELLDELFSLS
jgi:hypothetical protein